MANRNPSTRDPEASERADTLMPKKSRATRVVALVIAAVVGIALIVSLIWV